MRTELFLITSLALLGACAPEEVDTTDTDDDGLLDSEEESLGTDPALPDTDGDTLTDGDEVNTHGTDPLLVDTDADAYQDNWELAEGSNPIDAASMIYQGGWPYNPDKAQYDGRVWEDAGINGGDPIPAHEFMDKFGDMVNLGDFADHGKYIVLDIPAMWCGPCNGLASWISGGSDMGYGFGSSYPNLPEAVASGEIYWISLIGQDYGGSDVDQSELETWYELYPDPVIPVMADNGPGLDIFIAETNAFPTVVLLNEKLEIASGPTIFDYYAALTEAEAIVSK
jgi:hypothetical protein